MSAASETTDTNRPDPSEFQRFTQREWQVVNVDTEGITFSIDDFQHGARLVADRWLRTCGPGHQLVFVDYEYWVSPSRVVARVEVDRILSGFVPANSDADQGEHRQDGR